MLLPILYVQNNSRVITPQKPNYSIIIDKNAGIPITITCYTEYAGEQYKKHTN